MKNGIMKLCALLIILCTASMLLCGCSYSGYKSKYAGAYTLTYSQIPGTRGASQVLFAFRDPQIILLERDSQGRGLYLYLEDTEGPLSAVIVQGEHENKVFFYPEKCYISLKTPDRIFDSFNKSLSDEALTELFYELCPEGKLDELKEKNDWNKPIDETKLESAKITKPRIANTWSYRTGKVITPFFEWRDLILAVAVENGHNVPESYLEGNSGMNIYDSYMATDKYGRELHYIETDYNVYSDDGVYPSYYTTYYLQMVAIINPDGSFDPDSFMIELESIYDPADQINELKERCGWNMPYEEVDR